MNRPERERDEVFAKNVVAECEYATIATVNADNTPYCLPISIALFEDSIYFHCAQKGKKVDNILNNENVCLSCVSYTKLAPKKYTTEYKSAIINGVCTRVDDQEEKITALLSICKKYAPQDLDSAKKVIDSWIKKTAVFKIKICEISGKENML